MRTAIRTLLVIALGLPVVQAVLVWVGALLTSMGDDRGAAFVRGVGTLFLVAWTVALVGLLILVAVVVGTEEGRGLRVASREPEEDE